MDWGCLQPAVSRTAAARCWCGCPAAPCRSRRCPRSPGWRPPASCMPVAGRRCRSASADAGHRSSSSARSTGQLVHRHRGFDRLDPGAALTAYQPSWGHTQDDRFRPIADLTAAGPKRSAACRRGGRSRRGRRPRAFPAHTAPQWSAAATSDRRSSLRRSQSRRASRPRKTSNRGSSRMSSKTTACPCRRGRSGDLRSCRPVRRGSRPTNRRERPCAACSCRSCKGRCSSARLQPRPGMRRRRTSTFGPSLPPKLAPRSASVARPTSAYPQKLPLQGNLLCGRTRRVEGATTAGCCCRNRSKPLC